MCSFSSTSKLRALWVLLALLFVGALFWRVQSYPFLDWDDGIYVGDRTVFKRIARGETAALHELLQPSHTQRSRVLDYYPVRDLSYALDVWMAGAVHPKPLHRTNLWLHLLCMWLLYFLARRLGLKVWSSCFAMLLFGLHPLTVEPVAWISGRKDVLFVALGLGSLLFFWQMSEAKTPVTRWSNYLGFVLLLGLSLATKGPAVSFLLLAALLVFCMPAPSRKRQWLSLLPVSVPAGLWVLWSIRWGRKVGNIVHGESGIPAYFRALGAPLRALSRALFPFSLSPEYGQWDKLWWQDPHSWGMVCVLVLLFLLWRRKYRLWSRRVWVLWVAVVCAVLPTSGVVTVGQIQADRFLYLALVFLALLLAWWTQSLQQHSSRLLWLPLGLLALYTPITHQYLGSWQSDIRLWATAYQHTPDVPRVNRMLATTALKASRLHVARRFYERTLRMTPKDIQSWNSLGRIWAEFARTHYRGKRSFSLLEARNKALQCYSKALRLAPRYDMIWRNIGELWYFWATDHSTNAPIKADALKRAKAPLQRAFQLVPHQILHVINMGLLAREEKRWPLAEQWFRRALSARTTIGDDMLRDKAVYNLADSLWKQGKKRQARRTAVQWQRRLAKHRFTRYWLAQHPLAKTPSHSIAHPTSRQAQPPTPSTTPSSTRP